MVSKQERIAGGLIGLLVGDALGVPYEFHAPQEIPAISEIEFTPPLGYSRSHAQVPPGTWSDDGAQALCLLASLLQYGHFDPEDFGRRLLNWYDWGYMAVDGLVFDVGIQTGQAIRVLRTGTPALQAGLTAESANGNGSLMRVLPLALWHKGTDAELVADARAQSQVTHGHLRSQLCCALYCLWARAILQECLNPWDDAVQNLRQTLANDAAAIGELEFFIRPDAPPEGKGSGYVVDCLRSARMVLLKENGYEQVVKASIQLGNDTDTTACVAGGMAGLREGISAIPSRWRDGLRGNELLEPLLEKLLSSS
ncbi:MAG: ADP-ribosylglycohydrolase family protein [Anaerolineae bacterium]|nr:ADP-ribosylglycohydrolase family protein [Gloeobacterales cyanobacterium ES-bin-313]